MQCSGPSSSGICHTPAARREAGALMQNLRCRPVSGPLSHRSAPCKRAVIVASTAGRRSPANWPADNNQSGPGLVRSVPAMKTSNNALSGQGNMTAIMPEGGKSSTLRKLVVDGVDDSTSVQVKFCLKYRTSYGQSVKIIGSHPKLGSWDINKALVLSWTEGDRWVATIELPAGSVYEYKYVLVDHDGRSALAWQGGSNSVLAVGDSDEREGVEVQDNWNNNPGQAAVIANGLTTTREDKLQAWAAEMRQYRVLARTAQYELSRKAEELQASKAQIARLKMELSVSLKAREDLEARLAEMESENLTLRAQVAQSQIAMKSTLEEAIKLLQQEIEEGEEEMYGVEDEEMPAAATSGGASSSGGWGWGRSGASAVVSPKESEAVYVGSNGNGNGATFERFGFRLSGNAFDNSDQTGLRPHDLSGGAASSSSTSSFSSGSHVLSDWRSRLGGSQ